MGLFGLTDYETEKQYRDGSWQSRNAAFDTAGALRKGGYDKQEAENLFQEQMPMIEQGASRAAKQTATGYGNRGLGKSGMAMASQNDVALQRAIAARSARLASINAATGNQFKNNAAAMAGYNTIYGQDSSNYQQLAQRNQQGILDLIGLGTSIAGSAVGFGAGGGFGGGGGMGEFNLPGPGIAMPQADMVPQGFGGGLQPQDLLALLGYGNGGQG
jgi:hypothetical protein